MISRFLLATLLAMLPAVTGVAVAGPARADDAPAKMFDLPYQMTELDNGLKVIVVRTDTTIAKPNCSGVIV